MSRLAREEGQSCETNPISLAGRRSRARACPELAEGTPNPRGGPVRRTKPIRPAAHGWGNAGCRAGTNKANSAEGSGVANAFWRRSYGALDMYRDPEKQSQFVPAGKEWWGKPHPTRRFYYAKQTQFGGFQPRPGGDCAKRTQFPPGPGGTGLQGRGPRGNHAKRTQSGGVRPGPDGGCAKRSQFGAARPASRGHLRKTNPISPSRPAKYPACHHSIVPLFQPDAGAPDHRQASKTSLAAATHRRYPGFGPVRGCGRASWRLVLGRAVTIMANGPM
jgi:hypothetical protein